MNKMGLILLVGSVSSIMSFEGGNGTLAQRDRSGSLASVMSGALKSLVPGARSASSSSLQAASVQRHSAIEEANGQIPLAEFRRREELIVNSSIWPAGENSFGAYPNVFYPQYLLAAGNAYVKLFAGRDERTVTQIESAMRWILKTYMPAFQLLNAAREARGMRLHNEAQSQRAQAHFSRFQELLSERVSQANAEYHKQQLATAAAEKEVVIAGIIAQRRGAKRKQDEIHRGRKKTNFNHRKQSQV